MRDEILTVACVLRSGGDFILEDVSNLAKSVNRHFGKVRFICLTDYTEPVSSEAVKFIPLVKLWPSWWAKMELFNLVGPIITLDLDSVPVRDCQDMDLFVRSLGSNDFMCLKDFGRVPYGSGLMAWGKADMRWLFKLFDNDYLKAKHEVSASGYHLYIGGRRYMGDQAYMTQYVPKRMKIILAQDKFDGIDSYKWGVVKNGFKENQRMVFFHGKPRPHQVNPMPEWLIREGWTRERKF